MICTCWFPGLMQSHTLHPARQRGALWKSSGCQSYDIKSAFRLHVTCGPKRPRRDKGRSTRRRQGPGGGGEGSRKREMIREAEDWDDDGSTGRLQGLSQQIRREQRRQVSRGKKEQRGTQGTAGSKANSSKSSGRAGDELKGNSIMWFRQDLRLHDNPALKAATDAGGTVVCTYVWSPSEEGNGTSWASGGASNVFLHETLVRLDADLQAMRGDRGGLLHCKGPCLEALLRVAHAVGATNIFWNRRYEPALLELDRHVESGLRQAGLKIRTFNALLLHEPWAVQIDMSRWHGHFGTLMPFYHA
ncbi:hypothetical protein CYMTET_32160, partial [Cymbomonas tetramitiformis]